MEEEKGAPESPTIEDEEDEEAKKEQVSFSTNLWGSVDAIRENCKKGINILEGVTQFTKSFQKAYENYGLAISKSLDVFEREMLKYNTLDTTTICMSSFCSEMKNMVEDMREKAAEFDELLYNPSVLFTKHYEEQSK